MGQHVSTMGGPSNEPTYSLEVAMNHFHAMEVDQPFRGACQLVYFYQHQSEE